MSVTKPKRAKKEVDHVLTRNELRSFEKARDFDYAVEEKEVDHVC